MAANGYVGASGSGSFSQSGGTCNVTTLYVGYAWSSSGGYSLSGTGQLSGKAEYVGYFGTGAFTQSGGTNSSELLLGYLPGSNGSYNLRGTGTFSATASIEYAGYSGAVPLRSPAAPTRSRISILATMPAPTGAYTLQGGLLLTAYLTVGLSGTGTFTQSGGTSTCGKELYVGSSAGGSTYNQSGGANAVSDLYVGDNSSAAYNLSGGSLSSFDEYVGWSGTGSFTQSGGTNNAETLWLGVSGGTGTYNLNGGVLVVTSIALNGGYPVFNFSGGTLRASATVSGGYALPMTLGARKRSND